MDTHTSRLRSIRGSSSGPSCTWLSKTDASPLRRAISHIAAWEGRSEPPIDVMRVVRETDLAVQLWQRYVSTALMPLAGSSLATRREMTGLNSQTLGRIESKVNELMQRCTDGELAETAQSVEECATY